MREIWRIRRADSIDRLRLERETLARPGPGEVRVAVRSIGVNLADVFACLGLYSATPPAPFVPGFELAGVVDAVGPSAPGDDVRATPRWRPGDRVIALTRFGAYATAVNADARYLRPLHDRWSFDEGAAFPVQAITAWYALHHLAQIRPGEIVLVHSAAGGVGLSALALIRAASGRAIATVGRDDKVDLLTRRLDLPREQVIVRDRRRFPDQLDQTLTRLGVDGLDIVLDGIAGRYFLPAFTRLRPEGRIVVFGASDMMPAGRRARRLWLLPRYLRRPRIDPMRMISSNRSVMAFNLIWLWDRVERLGRLYEAVQDVLRDPPLVGRVFPFSEVPEALRWIKTGNSVGKVIVAVPPA